MARYQKMIVKSRLLSSFFQNSSELEKVQAISIYLLDVNGKTDSRNTMSSDGLWQQYLALKSTMPDIVQVQQTTFVVYLSRLGSDRQSFIECPGKKQGYWFNRNRFLLASGQKYPSPAKVKESVLYPAVETWVGLNGYRYYGNISQMKRPGKWRNPDVIGVNISLLLGERCTEIATVEVKPTIKDWRSNIFEAVAHLMMANRSYFAFLCTPEEFRAEEMQMREYACRYGVGLIAIFENKERESGYDVELITLAPLHNASPSEQNYFLESNGIYSESDLQSKLKTTNP